MGKRLIAGPGQMPPSPHPSPKIADPIRSRESTTVLEGRLIFSARIGFFIILIM